MSAVHRLASRTQSSLRADGMQRSPSGHCSALRVLIIEFEQDAEFPACGRDAEFPSWALISTRPQDAAFPAQDAEFPANGMPRHPLGLAQLQDAEFPGGRRMQSSLPEDVMPRHSSVPRSFIGRRMQSSLPEDEMPRHSSVPEMLRHSGMPVQEFEGCRPLGVPI